MIKFYKYIISAVRLMYLKTLNKKIGGGFDSQKLFPNISLVLSPNLY